MFKALDTKLFIAKKRMDDFITDCINEERGASDIVAILLIIVVVVAVAVIFKEQLMNVVNAVFNQVTNFVNKK